ncbi:MAG: LptF/LptG family permease [Candidatus Obscuribacterales bacterium]|nr:LptF/LptG family permease [Candidatus Obscuribacterales bacterium]
MIGIKLLDRYIANEFWQPLLFGIGIVTGVWFGADQLKTIFNLIMKSGVPLNLAFMIIGLHLPEIIVMTIPIGVLLGTLLVFNRLSGDSEIIAIRTSGISFYRIMLAPLLFGLLTSFASFGINEYVVPLANRTSKKLEFLALYKSELPTGQANFTYMERGKDLALNRVYFIGFYDGKKIYNVIILDFTRNKLVQIISAAKGLWTHGEWVLEQGRTYVLAGDSDITRILKFDKLVIPGIQNAQKALDTQKVPPKDMSISELSAYMDLMKQSNSLGNDIMVRYYQKFSQPLACLIVALAGAPLGLLARRSRSNLGLVYSAVIVFLYYVLQSSSGALGDSGRLPAIVAAWLPNIVIGALGVIILYFKAK